MCRVSATDANATDFCPARRAHARSQRQRLLACRLLYEVIYEVFHEQWYCAAGAQQPGMAVLRRLLEQVSLEAFCRLYLGRMWPVPRELWQPLRYPAHTQQSLLGGQRHASLPATPCFNRLLATQRGKRRSSGLLSSPDPDIWPQAYKMLLWQINIMIFYIPQFNYLSLFWLMAGSERRRHRGVRRRAGRVPAGDAVGAAARGRHVPRLRVPRSVYFRRPSCGRALML